MAEVEVGQSSSRRARRWALLGGGLLVLALLLVGYVWLAERHSDQLRLVRDPDTQLVRVEKGWYAPFGWATYTPTEAFTPVRLDPDIPIREGTCSRVADCEARLFDAVAEQARRLLRRRERLREASALIAQAVKLSGEANLSERLELEGDEQYVRGLLKLEEAAASLLDASRHFRRARAMGSHVFRDGQARWQQSLELLDDLRQSGVSIPGVEAGELEEDPNLDRALNPPARRPDAERAPTPAPSEEEPPAAEEPPAKAPRDDPTPPTDDTEASSPEGGVPEDWSEL